MKTLTAGSFLLNLTCGNAVSHVAQVTPFILYITSSKKKQLYFNSHKKTKQVVVSSYFLFIVVIVQKQHILI